MSNFDKPRTSEQASTCSSDLSLLLTPLDSWHTCHCMPVETGLDQRKTSIELDKSSSTSVKLVLHHLFFVASNDPWDAVTVARGDLGQVDQAYATTTRATSSHQRFNATPQRSEANIAPEMVMKSIVQ